VAAGAWAWYAEWPLETARQFALDVLPEPVRSWVAPWIETPAPPAPQAPRPPARPGVPGQQAASQPVGEAGPQLATALPVPPAAAPTAQPPAPRPAVPPAPAPQASAAPPPAAPVPVPPALPLAMPSAQPVPPPSPAATPPAVLATPPAAPRPFTLQVAAARQLAKAVALAERLRGGSWEAFTVPTETPGKGVNYRVFLGRFESEGSAAAARKELRAKGIKEQPVVRSLPYAIEVRNLTSADHAAGALQGLRDGGYMPVLRREGAEGAVDAKLTLVVDAFASQAETEPLTAFLQAHGLTPQVVDR